MKLNAFLVDLIESRVEYEVQRRIHPSFRRNFRQNIFPSESLGEKTRKQSQALLIRITFLKTYLINPLRPVWSVSGTISGLPLGLIGNASGQTLARQGDLDARRFR